MSTTIDRGAPASGKTDSGLRGSHAVRWWVLVVIGMAQLMIMLDATVVNIALPEAQQRPRLQRRQPAVGHHGLRAGVRQPAAARRPPW